MILNVAQRKKHVKRDFNNTWHCFVNDVTKHVFLHGEGLQTLILGIFTAKMLPTQCKSLICVEWLEMRFILLAISLINKSRDPFPFIYRLLDDVNTHTRTLLIASETYLNELEMYLKELVAFSLSFPHFRVNILTVILIYQSRDENLSF